MAIYDTMQSLKNPVATNCVGYAYNLAGFLLAAGDKGSRVAMPLCRVALQSPAEEARGQNEANELLRIRNYLYRELAKKTGQPIEKVYKFSIRAACQLNWPSDKIIIQVLDDSNDPTIKELLQIECGKWAEEGVNIKYESRPNRNGYKAGALREGLKKKYVDNCDYVAIFDADFQPEADFFWRTIPLFFSNPMLALVQARWKFGDYI